jgi:hypothetical protein
MNNDETTQCCWGFSWEKKYNQQEIEYIMDDYGGNVILINSETNSEKRITFSNCNYDTNIEHHRVTMVSDDYSTLLVLIFKRSASGRKLVTGNLIKNKNTFQIIKYDVFPTIEGDGDDNIAFAKCFYK